MSECKIGHAWLSEEVISARLNQPSTILPGSLPTVKSNGRIMDFRLASVLILLVCKDGEWHVLFTLRTEFLPEHKGQVAFPGGAREAGDQNAEETALRETLEEIGVKPNDVKLLGRLADLETHSGYLITPFVGTISWPYSMKLEEKEVAQVFTIPLAWLAEPTHHEKRFFNRDRKRRQAIFFDAYDGYLLWGISAQIMIDLLAKLNL